MEIKILFVGISGYGADNHNHILYYNIIHDHSVERIGTLTITK